MNDLAPIGLAEAWKAMLSHAGMTETIRFQQLPIDESIFGVDVKDSRTELVDVGHGINELTHQMAGIPLDAEVLIFCGVEETFPHGGLREHVITHNRQVIGSHRAVFESDTDALVGRGSGERFPEFNQSGQK